VARLTWWRPRAGSARGEARRDDVQRLAWQGRVPGCGVARDAPWSSRARAQRRWRGLSETAPEMGASSIGSAVSGVRTAPRLWSWCLLVRRGEAVAGTGLASGRRGHGGLGLITEEEDRGGRRGSVASAVGRWRARMRLAGRSYSAAARASWWSDGVRAVDATAGARGGIRASPLRKLQEARPGAGRGFGQGRFTAGSAQLGSCPRFAECCAALSSPAGACASRRGAAARLLASVGPMRRKGGGAVALLRVRALDCSPWSPMESRKEIGRRGRRHDRARMKKNPFSWLHLLLRLVSGFQGGDGWPPLPFAGTRWGRQEGKRHLPFSPEADGWGPEGTGPCICSMTTSRAG
jgi:hypothetical protein